jgi:hypothetical protein
LECKQRYPFNGRETIHNAVLKAVERASIGFVGKKITPLKPIE